MTGQHKVVYSSLPSHASGFSRYVLFVYKPKSARVRALVERIRRDPRFPRHIHTRDLFDTVLRYSGWPWAERQAAGDVWARYGAWQRAQDGVAA